jgi:hypothetical protein
MHTVQTARYWYSINKIWIKRLFSIHRTCTGTEESNDRNFPMQEPVLGIRIRIIRMFLGLQDPDPLVRGTYPRIRIHTKMSRIPNTGRNIIVPQ